MKKLINLFSACALLFLVSSCAKELRPFTANILREGNWSDTELQKIQFYLSDDIVIRRKLTEGSNEIASGVDVNFIIHVACIDCFDCKPKPQLGQLV